MQRFRWNRVASVSDERSCSKSLIESQMVGVEFLIKSSRMRAKAVIPQRSVARYHGLLSTRSLPGAYAPGFRLTPASRVKETFEAKLRYASACRAFTIAVN